MTDFLYKPLYHRFATAIVLACLAAGLLLAGCGDSKPPQTRTPLQPIPFPDLERLDEHAVRQINEHYAELQALQDDAEQPAQSDSLTAAYGEMSRIFHAYGFHDAARIGYRNAALLDPADYRWPYLLAHLDRRAGNIPTAQENFRQALELLQQSPYAPLQQQVAGLCWLGELDLQASRPDQAQQRFRKALALDEQTVAAWLGLAKAELAAGNPQQALPALTRASALMPGLGATHYQLGMAYRALGNLEWAKAHLEKAGSEGQSFSVHDPLLKSTLDKARGAGALVKQGKQAYQAGRLRQAAALYRQALALEPDNHLTHNNLAGVLLQLGQNQAAMEHFTEAVRLKPEFAHGYRALADIHHRRGELDQALTHLRQAERLAPQDLDVQLDIGRLLLQTGDLEGALDRFQAVRAADPAEARGALAAAETLKRLGQPAQALAVLEEAARLLPSNRRIREALEAHHQERR